MDSVLLTAPEMTSETMFRFVCKNCNECFRWEKDLSKHRRLDCKKKPFGCPECGQLLSRRDSLRQHLQRHDGGKKYPCQFCEKSFDQQQNLKVHLRIHSGEKPFRCPECGRQFNQSQNLTTHLRIHSGIKPYQCLDCGTKFRFCSGYKSHMARSHCCSNNCSQKTPAALIKKPLSSNLSNPQVQRVSVIARTMSSSTDSSFVSKSFDSNTKLGTESPNQVMSEDPTANVDLLNDFLPLKLRYICRICNTECSRQFEIMQHIVEAHQCAQYDVYEERLENDEPLLESVD